MTALPNDGYTLGSDQGEAFWFLGTRMTVKATGAETSGSLTVIEQVAPAGFSPPAHVHRLEDEAFYLLEGSMTVTCGGRNWVVEPGGFAFLPRGITHGFTVSPTGPARMLQLTTPAQFERFVAEVGHPATGPGLPTPAEPDIGALLASANRHQIEIVLPDHEPA